MAKRKPDAIKRFINQVEKNATKLRKDLKRFSRDTDLPHKLEEIAGELRRGAATVASEVEHYLHDLRTQMKSTTRKRRTARKKTAKKTARKTAKKTAKKGTAKRRRKTAAKRTRKTGKKRAGKRKTA